MLANEDFWDDLLGHLKQGVLVPIVGPELVTVEDGERRVMLVRRIAERLVERSQLKIDWTHEPCLDEAIAAYLAAKGRDQSERLYRVVNDILAELAPTPPESLIQLAAIRDFHLFVSTTFDATLARAIDRARFGGAARTRELAFAPSQSSAEQQANAKPSPDDEEVVLRLFGASSSMPQYALHEEDALEWMHALVSDPARLPEWLGFKLRQNPLLIIGCPFSDWVGRALTRLMSDTRLSLAGKQFFIVGANLRQRRRMDKFFHTFCSGSRVQVLEADPAQFVAELHERWLKRTPQAAQGSALVETEVPPPPPRGNIFISYVREDVTAARRLADTVSSIGGEVWLDERVLDPGTAWKAEILTSIGRGVRLFLPLVSRNTETRAEGVVFQEWGAAVERAKRMPPRRRFIVPIAIDPDYDGNPARIEQVPREFMDFDFGRAPEGQPDARLTAALTADIRAMRRAEPA